MKKEGDPDGSSSTPDKSYHLFCIGDWGFPTSARTRILQGMAAQATQLRRTRENQVEVVGTLSLGDNFYPEGITDENWMEKMKQFISLPWPYPVMSVLGNHDYMGDIRFQLGMMPKLFPLKWRMPGRFFYHCVGTYCFIGIDTVLLAPMESQACGLPAPSEEEDRARQEHLLWLESILRAMSKDYECIVFGHYPIFSCGVTHGNTPELMETVLPLLLKHNVRLYLSGHDHNLQLLKYKGLFCIVNGAGCMTAPVDARKCSPAIPLFLHDQSCGYVELTLTGTQGTHGRTPPSLATIFMSETKDVLFLGVL